MSELPTIQQWAATSTAYNMNAMNQLAGMQNVSAYDSSGYGGQQNFQASNQLAGMLGLPNVKHTPIAQRQELPVAEAKRRIVQVFIADPHELIPLNDALLYKSEQFLTDSTDQELFFEIDIKGILAAHNAKRTKIKHGAKDIGREAQALEPVRVRDLKMTVVVVASF